MDAAREYENYYEYDAAGNRTLLRHGETDAEDLTYYGYNAANELLSAHAKDGWTYFSYDMDGNTVAEQRPAYTRYYDWDGRDMMVRVRSTEPGWTDNVYRYGGLASRVSTLESIGLTYYDWDGINVIQEKDSTNTVTDRQVHGYAPIPSVGDIALMDKGGGSTYVPISDQVGTVWVLLDSTGAVANSYSYDAFGVGGGVTETIANRYRFGTKRLDADSGLYHFIARQYLSSAGRFMGRDQSGDGAGYVYVRQNPLVWADPDGEPLLLIVVGGVVLVGAAAGLYYLLRDRDARGMTEEEANKVTELLGAIKKASQDVQRGPCCFHIDAKDITPEEIRQNLQNTKIIGVFKSGTGYDFACETRKGLFGIGRRTILRTTFFDEKTPDGCESRWKDLIHESWHSSYGDMSETYAEDYADKVFECLGGKARCHGGDP